MEKVALATVIILLSIVLLFFWPFAVIWCLNALGTNIPMNLKTWFAVVVLCSLVRLSLIRSHD